MSCATGPAQSVAPPGSRSAGQQRLGERQLAGDEGAVLPAGGLQAPGCARSRRAGGPAQAGPGGALPGRSRSARPSRPGRTPSRSPWTRCCPDAGPACSTWCATYATAVASSRRTGRPGAAWRPSTTATGSWTSPSTGARSHGRTRRPAGPRSAATPGRPTARPTGRRRHGAPVALSLSGPASAEAANRIRHTPGRPSWLISGWSASACRRLGLRLLRQPTGLRTRLGPAGSRR